MAAPVHPVPDRVLEAGDPTARELFARYGDVNMPNLHLSPDDVAALVEYLAAEGRNPADRNAGAGRTEPAR